MKKEYLYTDAVDDADAVDDDDDDVYIVDDFYQ